MRNSGKGSITIFFCIILSVLILFLGILIDIARVHSAKSMAKESAQIALKSSASRYDRVLKELFGLFCIYENYTTHIKNAFDNSLQHTASQDLVLYKFNIENSEIKLFNSLTDIDVFKSQVINYMNTIGGKNILENTPDTLFIKNKINDFKQALPRDKIKLSHNDNLKFLSLKLVDEYPNIQEEYNKIKNNLPNKDIADKRPYSLDMFLQSPRDVIDNYFQNIEESQRNILINKYIMGNFKSFFSIKNKEKDFRDIMKKERITFFKNFEVEYILAGNENILDNIENIRLKILLLRLILNSSNNKEFSTALSISIQETEKIFKGRQVNAPSSYSYLTNYRDHLELLLLFLDENVKLKRLQNLIQLNMIKEGNEDFLLRDYCTGLEADMKIFVDHMFFTNIIYNKSDSKNREKLLIKLKSIYIY